MGEPTRRVRQIRTKAALVNDENRGVYDSVGKPRQRQRAIALASAQGQQPICARDILQKFDDDAAVVYRAVVGQDETGHLSERILLSQRIVLVKRVGRDDSNASVQAQHVDRHADFASKWRGRRRAQYIGFGDRHERFQPVYPCLYPGDLFDGSVYNQCSTLATSWENWATNNVRPRIGWLSRAAFPRTMCAGWRMSAISVSEPISH